MWMQRGFLLQLTICLLCTLHVTGFLCKWSNEGCSSDHECCSKRCEQGHPGTDARCTKSMMHQPCLYTYQCEERLKCGTHNKCCSKYWGTCRKPSDCCNKLHYCLEVEGFYYKRCLAGTIIHSAANTPGPFSISKYILYSISVGVATLYPSLRCTFS